MDHLGPVGVGGGAEMGDAGVGAVVGWVFLGCVWWGTREEIFEHRSSGLLGESHWEAFLNFDPQILNKRK